MKRTHHPNNNLNQLIMLRNQIQKVAIIALAMLFSLIENTYAQWEPFSGACDFEPNENCDFIVIDTAAENTWVIAKPQKVFFDSAYSNERSILTDSVNLYPPNNYSFFDIPITVSYGNLFVEFWHKFDTDTLEDGGYITISYDSGSTWYNILDVGVQIDTYFNLGGLSQYIEFYTDSSMLHNGERGFSGNSGGWVRSDFLLYWYQAVSYGDFRGREGDIILRFNFVSDSVDNGKEGWMIDRLKIIEEVQGSVKELNQQNFNLFPNPANDVVHIRLKNPGTATRYQYTITDITGRVLERKQFSGEQKIEVSSWKKGIYIVTVYEYDVPIGVSKLVVM